jgi:glycosyltransferase involved in cell wall biosynthesis
MDVPLRIAFASCNGSWGGSEDLWSRAAIAMAEAGHDVRVYKPRFDPELRELAQLRALGCRPVELTKLPLIPRSINPSITRFSNSLARWYGATRLAAGLGRQRPQLCVISQGSNHDGWWLACVCQRRNQPFVIISQHASEMTWPSDRMRRTLVAIYKDARHCFFVAEDNRRITEEQLGMRLPHASVVRNPFRVDWDEQPAWPDDEVLRLACVGRLQVDHKGQDILLRVLAAAKWRARPLQVTFFGEGPHVEGVEGMARLLELQNVTFAGHVADPASIWAGHHGLALPSRGEGLPLVVVEAMMSGRVPIVTRVAGNPEVVEQGVTGFLADAATAEAFDAALERAWQARDRLKAIGEEASRRIRMLVPRDPGVALADRLTALTETIATEAKHPVGGR